MGLATATASAIVLAAGPASAAPPINDTISTATTITTVPFTDTVDTTEATTDEEDAAVNSGCGAPVTNGSVWYSLTAGDAPAYIVDVTQSSYQAGVIVATGTPGDLTLVNCGPGSIGFQSVPGETYYLMAFSDDPNQYTWSAKGGIFYKNEYWKDKTSLATATVFTVASGQTVKNNPDLNKK